MKIYFIILDGAADWKIKELGNRTPLQAAKTPFLDQLVLNGEQSLIEILPNKMTPETDSGLMALLGYDPMKYYCGRGTLEAIGLGLNKDYKYYVGFRINFASLNLKEGVLDRRTSRDLSNDELQQLTEEIKDKISLSKFPGVSFDLVSFGAHRGILCFYSNEVALSGNVSNTDPCYEKKGCFSEPKPDYIMKPQKCIPLDESSAAAFTADLLNNFVKQCESILSNSSVNRHRMENGKKQSNCIIVRDGGSKPYGMQPFNEKNKRSITIYGGLPCEKALAKLICCNFCYTKALELQLDGEYLMDLANKQLKSDSDIVFCHLKGPDEPGHDHNPIGKVEAIELIDGCFLREIVNAKQREDIVIVTCDHSTPCELGLHSGDKVPLLISGGAVYPDDTVHFDETNASNGECIVHKATDVLDYAISMIGKS